MRLINAAAITTSLIAACGPAIAGDRVSEADYLRAARCHTLAHASQLGATDTSGIDAHMKVQSAKRSPAVERMILRERGLVARQVATPGAAERLKAERDQRCAAWLVPAQVASSSGAR